MISITASTPTSAARAIAARVRQRRLELNLTQRALAQRAGMKLPTYRRFEQTAEVSLRGLLQIAFALDMLDDFDRLFSQEQYMSLDDVIAQTASPRQRGRNNE